MGVGVEAEVGVMDGVLVLVGDKVDVESIIFVDICDEDGEIMGDSFVCPMQDDRRKNKKKAIIKKFK